MCFVLYKDKYLLSKCMNYRAKAAKMTALLKLNQAIEIICYLVWDLGYLLEWSTKGFVFSRKADADQSIPFLEKKEPCVIYYLVIISNATIFFPFLISPALTFYLIHWIHFTFFWSQILIIKEKKQKTKKHRQFWSWFEKWNAVICLHCISCLLNFYILWNKTSWCQVSSQ